MICALSPTGLRPWFSKTKGNTYATLLHHPFLFKGKTNASSRSSSNANLRAERGLLRAKIFGSAQQEEETTALLKRTGVIVKKLMDGNAMLLIERERLVKESVDAAKQRIKDMKLMKEIIATRREN